MPHATPLIALISIGVVLAFLAGSAAQRFEFEDQAIASLRNDANPKFGIEDPSLPLQVTTAAITLQALLADFK